MPEQPIPKVDHPAVEPNIRIAISAMESAANRIGVVPDGVGRTVEHLESARELIAEAILELRDWATKNGIELLAGMKT